MFAYAVYALNWVASVIDLINVTTVHTFMISHRFLVSVHVVCVKKYLRRFLGLCVVKTLSFFPLRNFFLKLFTLQIPITWTPENYFMWTKFKFRF
jgi:hypothetical protein